MEADPVICGVIVFFTALVQSAIVLFGGGRRILFRGSVCSLPYAGKALGPVITLLIGDFGEEVFGVFLGKIIIQAIDLNGGGYRNRTGVHGFAIRCITTLPTGLKR